MVPALVLKSKVNRQHEDFGWLNIFIPLSNRKKHMFRTHSWADLLYSCQVKKGMKLLCVDNPLVKFYILQTDVKHTTIKA